MKLAREVYDRKPRLPRSMAAVSAGPGSAASAFVSSGKSAGFKPGGPHTPNRHEDDGVEMSSIHSPGNSSEIRLTRMEWGRLLVSHATPDERPVIDRVLHRLKRNDRQMHES
jgi:hypothetical protein